jgi:hypothetical protein
MLEFRFNIRWGGSFVKTRMKVWTAAEVEQLRSLAKAKLSAAAIARKMRRTRGSVTQKALTLQVRFRSIQRRRRKS